MQVCGKKAVCKAIGAVSLIAFFILLDQLSKWAILEKLFKPELGAIKAGESIGFFEWLTSTARLDFVTINILPFFNLTMVWNHGISFGLFQSGTPWPLIVMSLIISGIFGIWLWRSSSKVEFTALCLIIGGAIGNVIDRLHLGAVADFLDFHYNKWHYPAFNLADSFITVGIVILVVYSLFFDKSNKAAN